MNYLAIYVFHAGISNSSWINNIFDYLNSFKNEKNNSTEE